MIVAALVGVLAYSLICICLSQVSLLLFSLRSILKDMNLPHAALSLALFPV